MKLLLDESAEYRLADWLISQGHSVITIARDYPRALSDQEVLAVARQEKRILITNDRDFGELIFRHGLSHAGVIYFRMGSANIEAKIGRLRALLLSHYDRLDSFIVVTERSVRIRQITSR